MILDFCESWLYKNLMSAGRAEQDPKKVTETLRRMVSKAPGGVIFEAIRIGKELDLLRKQRLPENLKTLLESTPDQDTLRKHLVSRIGQLDDRLDNLGPGSENTSFTLAEQKRLLKIGQKTLNADVLESFK